ncbi:MAG: 16S rRNA (guanine(966)-N(2))-methyltransferase RsmD [Longimicrobiales bacterium]|nr:16S rRNA (guanine(966)-N(2))-methyltransferase RsmD [Longimicrobiales bacterium]
MRIIAGRWRGHPIQAPPSRGTRPTTDRVREAWMSMLQPAVADARVLDLFAGSGALGLETLSRGARHVTFVERSGRVLRVLRSNIETLGAGAECRVVRDDALRFVEGLGPDAYDIVVADPPYGSGEAAALAQTFLRRPFADMLWIEHRVTDALPEAEGADTRRYGDTEITRYPRPD